MFNVRTATAAELVAFYNANAVSHGKPLIKKFSDRATAEKRCGALAAELAAKEAAALRELVTSQATTSADTIVDPTVEQSTSARTGATVVRSKARSGEVRAATKASPFPTVTPAPVVARKTASAPAPAPTAPARTSEASTRLYRIDSNAAAKVKRGAIKTAVDAMLGRTFTREEFAAACGTEVNSLRHFYWAKAHAVVVAA
jgi:hypothetical protein